MLNKKSNYLVVLIATHNRLGLLKKSINSVIDNTKIPNEVIVIDGGSTDGTIEYLKKRKDITPVFQNKLLGTARAYNRVWRKIKCQYTVWLSDDTEITKGSLDLAVNILEKGDDIGMVGLKMKDTMGTGKKISYMGGISEYGILNCNHGVLTYHLLKSVGFFNENYRSYTIDPDLTASVLCTGKKVVMTKKIAVLHHREYIDKEIFDEHYKKLTRGIDNLKIYQKKFIFLKKNPNDMEYKIRRILNRLIKSLGNGKQDLKKIINGTFIRLTDNFDNRNNPYHLEQKIPTGLLLKRGNPYVKLVGKI